MNYFPDTRPSGLNYSRIVFPRLLCTLFLCLLVSAAAFAKTYTITITKTSDTEGTLEFYDGGLSLYESCWFTNNPFEKGSSYTGYITRMSTKTDSKYPDQLRPGIYIPYPDREIFIHEGTGPDWSTGCIVIDRDKMIELWNYIYEDNPRNYNNGSGNTIRIVIK
jgi:hypothetical protein